VTSDPSSFIRPGVANFHGGSSVASATTSEFAAAVVRLSKSFTIAATIVSSNASLAKALASSSVASASAKDAATAVAVLSSIDIRSILLLSALDGDFDAASATIFLASAAELLVGAAFNSFNFNKDSAIS
jgi:hypothetical protein